MTSDTEFESVLSAIRPRLHRYCARMAGSATEGEDLVQEVLFRAIRARSAGDRIDNHEAWLFRVAHNASMDLLRQRAKASLVPLDDHIGADIEAPEHPEMAALSFRLFLHLAPLQRCAVVLKDVLGYSIEDIATIAGCSAAAAKSALQRGRVRLRALSDEDRADVRLPLLGDEERKNLRGYVEAFRAGDFDAIRHMLSQEVKLDLVNRLKLSGRSGVAPYFTRYAEAPQWRFAFGAVDGVPAMLVFDAGASIDRPSHFVTIDWQAGMVAGIRDYLFVPYVLEGAEWARLG